MKLDHMKLVVLIVLSGGYIVLVGMTILGIIFTSLTQAEGGEIIEEVSKVLPPLIGLAVGNIFAGAKSSAEKKQD